MDSHSIKLMLLGLTAAVCGVVLVLAGLVVVLSEALHPNDSGAVAILVLLGLLAAGSGLAAAYVTAMSTGRIRATREEV